MATDEPELDTDNQIRRSVGRTIANWTAVLVSLAVIGGWAVTGVYELQPGEAAVILQVGKFNRTVDVPGLRWHLPEPLEYHQVVNVTQIRRLDFGGTEGGKAAPSAPGDAESEPGAGAEAAARSAFESAIQTTDRNIVNLRYVLQYTIDDAFTFLYGMADPRETLHDATQAAVRETVGHRTVDAVLSAERAEIQNEAQSILETTLTSYFAAEGHRSPFDIKEIQLQDVQPPAQVQDAFDDVVSAQQDEERAISEARGDATEILERAGAEAVEMREGAEAYKEAKVLESTGESQRFTSLLAEYERAPEVTRRRLYLETMETVLPGVEKVIVEPDTVNMFPLLPLQAGRAAPAVTPLAAGENTGR